MNGGVIGLVAGVGACDIAPVCAVDAAPPFEASDALGWGVIGGQITMEDKGPAEAFGLGNVACCGGEGGELGVSDGGCAHEEGFDCGGLRRVFAIIGDARVGCAAQGLATGDKDGMGRDAARALGCVGRGGAGIAAGRAAGFFHARRLRLSGGACKARGAFFFNGILQELV